MGQSPETSICSSRFPSGVCTKRAAPHNLPMAFVHALGKIEKQRNPTYIVPDLLVKLKEDRLLSGSTLAMKKGQRGHELYFPIGKAQQLRVADEIMAVRVMIGKGNKYADIVEQRGIEQQLPGSGRSGVQALRPCAVEQLQGKPGHMKGVLFLKAAETGKLKDAFLPRGEPSLVSGRGTHEVVDQNAVLEIAVAHDDAFKALFFHHGLENGGPGNENVRTGGIDARYAAAFLRRAGAQLPNGFGSARHS